jgi:EmrB/QacA subfamily drug resistance transporter
MNRKMLILAALGCCFLVVMMDNTIINVALRQIHADLGASNSQLQWSVDSYILVYAALMFSAGVLADAYGRRRVLLIGLVVFAAASAMSAFASSPEQLVIWRAVMGIGGAVVPPTTLAIIKEVFSEKEQGRAMGVWAALGGLSVAFGPILGGFLLENFWWGSVFLINVPVVVVCAGLILVVVPESRAPKRNPVDLIGVLLSMAVIGVLVYGVIRGGETSHWLRPDTGGAILASGVLLVLLVLFERRQAVPALDVTLFRSTAFVAGTMSIAVAFFALTGGTFLLVFYVQLIRGNTPLELGFILLPVAIGSVVSAVGSSTVVARRGARFAVVLGLFFLLVAFVGMVRLDQHSALLLLEVDLLFAGLGMGLVMGTTTPLVMSVVEPHKAGVGAAVNNTLRQVGAALGVAVMGSVYSVRYRSELGDAAAALPASIRSEATDSLAGSLTVLDALVHTGRIPATVASGLTDQADAAFIASMHATVWVAIGVLAIGAALGLVGLPGRRPAPGREVPALRAPADSTSHESRVTS